MYCSAFDKLAAHQLLVAPFVLVSSRAKILFLFFFFPNHIILLSSRQLTAILGSNHMPSSTQLTPENKFGYLNNKDPSRVTKRRAKAQKAAATRMVEHCQAQAAAKSTALADARKQELATGVSQAITNEIVSVCSGH